MDLLDFLALCTCVTISGPDSAPTEDKQNYVNIEQWLELYFNYKDKGIRFNIIWKLPRRRFVFIIHNPRVIGRFLAKPHFKSIEQSQSRFVPASMTTWSPYGPIFQYGTRIEPIWVPSNTH